MSNADLTFQNQIEHVINNGNWDENPRPKYRDGTPAYSKYITQTYENYDLSMNDFPITTLRPIGWESGIKEMLWIFQDQTSDLYTLENRHGVKWWRDWEVSDSNNIGQRYGATIKKYDLMNQLLYNLKYNTFSRRHIMDMWQEDDFKSTEGLLPCAFLTMWTPRRVNNDIYLDLTLVMRSSDFLIAGHINMIQYVALQMMVAHECGMKVGKFVRFTQNLHIYDRNFDQANELLAREPSMKMPRLVLNAEGKSFYDITLDDFEMIDYDPVRPQLKFELGI